MYYQQRISGVNNVQLVIIRARRSQSFFNVKNIFESFFHAYRYQLISAAIYIALFAGLKEWGVTGHKPEILSFSSCENIIRLPQGNVPKFPTFNPNPMSKTKAPEISVKPEICLQPVTITKPMPNITVPNQIINTKPTFSALNPALSLKPFRCVTVPNPVLNANTVTSHDTSIRRQKMVKHTVEANGGCSDTVGIGSFSGKGNNGFSGAGGYARKPQDKVIDPKLSNIGNIYIVSITVTLYSDAYSIPDTFQVIYQDCVYLNTGSTSGKRTNKILIDTRTLLNPGSGQLTIRVISHPNVKTTLWEWRARVDYALAPF